MPFGSMERQPLTILLASPRGFCAGVDRAIQIVERALEKFGPPVYVRHEIVHNRRVVEALRDKGAVFVESLAEVPEGAPTIFSAHGVSRAVEDEAARRGLPVIDATCPLVGKVHNEGRRHALEGRQVVLIGHDGHPEVEGTRGRVPGGVHLVTRPADVEALELGEPAGIAFITQTTLSVDDTRAVIEALRRRFPAIVGPGLDDICYATQNRQQALRAVAAGVDLVLVVGAANSSNSNRLREIGDETGVPSRLVADAQAIDPAWLDGVEAVAVTAGASAPEDSVAEVVDRLRALRPASTVEEVQGVAEDIHFKLPPSLSEA
ncbi:MAG: 4-hydroxy-3-methylbut-2-enyl diphosphate reductase [Alphaproteobacteria bacterium]|nr:4-hydroxy-3-methylbut-2-enyl diphosphate reductase [Alphaproteobacteria bacterium]